MSAKLAIWICICFIAYLFFIDRKDQSRVSLGLWVPTIWVLILGSRMVSQWFNTESSTITPDVYLEGSSFDRVIFLMLILSGVIIFIKRRISFSALVLNNKWIFVYLIYCAMSILWSDYPFVAVKRYVKEIGNLIMAVVVLSEKDLLEAIRVLIRRCAFILIPFSVVLYKYFPGLGRGYGKWEGELFVTGVTNGKNSLGVLCLVCSIFLIWDLASRWRGECVSGDKMAIMIRSGILAITIWVLILANSATSIICFLVGIMVLAMTAVKRIRRKVVTLGFVLILGGLSIFYFTDMLSNITGLLYRDDTLTGRTEIWPKVVELVSNPIIGTGYRSFWLGERLKMMWVACGAEIQEAHNGYLEVYSELGVVGVILISGVLIAAMQSILKCLHDQVEYGSLRLAFLVITIIYNITESGFRVDLLIYFIFLLIAINFPRSYLTIARLREEIMKGR